MPLLPVKKSSSEPKIDRLDSPGHEDSFDDVKNVDSEEDEEQDELLEKGKEWLDLGSSTIPFNPSDPLPLVHAAPQPNSEEELAEKLKQIPSQRGKLAGGQHFMEIVCGEKFLKWPLASVVAFLNHNDLAIESEADVLCAAVRWLSANWAVRASYVEIVMDCVRFGLMSELTLLSALYNPLTSTVLAEPYCRECIFRAICSHRARRLGLDGLVHRIQARNRYKLRTRKGLKDDSNTKLDVVSGCFLCPSLAVRSKSLESGQRITREEIEAQTREGLRRGTTDHEAVRVWAATIIQAWYRGVRDRRCLVLLHLAVGVVQAIWRGRRQRKAYLQLIRAVIKIQAWWKGYLARKELAILQLAAIIIQAAWRRYQAREAFLLAKDAVTIIAAAWRGYKVRKEIKRLSRSAGIIQRIYRGYRCRMEINLCRPLATCAESCIGQMLVSPPMTLTSTDAVLVIGGGNPLDSTNSSTRGRALLRYDPVLHSWRLMGYMPTCHFFAVAVSLGDSVVMTGGCETDQLPPSPSRGVWRLNVVRGTWQLLSPMLAARLFHSVLAVGDVVLAMGGKTWGDRLIRSVEALSHCQGQWRQRASLSHPRMGMGATVHQTKVWVCGGLEKSPRLDFEVPTDAIECYDLDTDSWTVGCVRLRFPRIFSSLVSVPGGLLLVGGATKEMGLTHAHLMSLAAVDYLAEDQTEWTLHTYLTTARHHAHAVYIDGRVLVIGGVLHQEELALAGVECCNLPNQVAKNYPETDLPHPLAGHACVVLHRRREVPICPAGMPDSCHQLERLRPPAGKAKRSLPTPPPPQCQMSSSSSSPLVTPRLALKQAVQDLTGEQATTAALMMEHVRALTEEWARRGWSDEELANPSSIWEEEEEVETEHRPSSRPLTAKSLGPLGPCNHLAGQHTTKPC